MSKCEYALNAFNKKANILFSENCGHFLMTIVNDPPRYDAALVIIKCCHKNSV